MCVFEDDVALVPTATLRFSIEGAPPGTFLVFGEVAESVSTMKIFQGGNPIIELSRRE